MKESRVQEKSSRTAAYTCCMRAASFLEKNAYYHSDDSIAPVLLPAFVRVFIGVIKKLLAPRGIYEYVIARTKYIDSIFERAIHDSFEQILIFGAGYDSRGIRFCQKDKHIRIFELDANHTQEAKLSQLTRRKIKSPPNIVYIPIDFNHERVGDKLSESGFIKNTKSLFILEGLIMYLDKAAVDNIFRIVNELSGKGSRVVFDYVHASVLRKENTCYGEKNIHRVVLNTREPWKFGVEKGGIDIFLQSRRFKLLEHFDSNALENLYFKEPSGRITGRINGTHCLVLAERK